MIAGAAIFRGQYSTFDLESSINNYICSNSSWFVDWITNNVELSMCDVSAPERSVSSLMINNNTVSSSIFNRIKNQFNALYKTKAHVHWYTNEGMDTNEFSEGTNHLSEIASEYEHYSRVTDEEADGYDG